MIDETLKEFYRVGLAIDTSKIQRIVDILKSCKGRLFILGIGGSAANASHAVNDFRKICGIESYAPTDNVAELTARTNDIGWDSIFVDWLKTSKLSEEDVVFVFSVGGGTETASQNILKAVEYADEVKATIIGIVGPNGGKTSELANACIRIPATDEFKTPFTEAYQAVLWHIIALEVKACQ